MDEANLKLAATSWISPSYVAQGQQALAARHKQVKAVLSSRRLPEQGWDEASIEMLLQDCAAMDSNNFIGNVGVGEREGRVACPMVARRHFRLAHGIGRSGDIAAEQPKAAGSSLLAKLTNVLVADAFRLAGLGDLGAVTVLPLATGMTMSCVLQAIRAARPASAKWVVWSRVDQKTCLKAITAAGLQPFVVELRLVGDELHTDVAAIQAAVEELGADNVVAIVTTTSCFAPRASDDVVAVAKLCAARGVPHMINNAYGVQSAHLCRLITSAWRKGRVDAVVQSTDKNFMVPVGGAVVMQGVRSQGVVEAVNQAYPGRASIAASLDLLLTLLHWGASGWRQVLQDREALYPYLQQALTTTAAAHGQRVLLTPGNPISLAVTLDQGQLAQLPSHTFLGSQLWARYVSGTRVVGHGKQQEVAGLQFSDYGAHHSAYPHIYLTAAAAVGGSREEVDEFCARLGKCLSEAVKTRRPAAQPALDQLALDRPASDQPASDQPPSDQPASDQPASDQPPSDHPVSDQPASDQPALEGPALNQPAANLAGSS